MICPVCHQKRIYLFEMPLNIHIDIGEDIHTYKRDGIDSQNKQSTICIMCLEFELKQL